MKYVIYKGSRIPGSVSYSGPTWDRANLRHKYKEQYQEREEAKALALELSRYNPVGFDVGAING